MNFSRLAKCARIQYRSAPNGRPPYRFARSKTALAASSAGTPSSRATDATDGGGQPAAIAPLPSAPRASHPKRGARNASTARPTWATYTVNERRAIARANVAASAAARPRGRSARRSNCESARASSANASRRTATSPARGQVPRGEARRALLHRCRMLAQRGAHAKASQAENEGRDRVLLRLLARPQP